MPIVDRSSLSQPEPTTGGIRRPRPNATLAGDVVDVAQAGILGFGSSAAEGVNQALGGGPGVLRDVADYIGGQAAAQYQTLRPESHEALTHPVFVGDTVRDLRVNPDVTPLGVGLQAVQGAASTLPFMLAGGVVGGVARAALPTAARVLAAPLGYGAVNALSVGGEAANTALEHADALPPEQQEQVAHKAALPAFGLGAVTGGVAGPILEGVFKGGSGIVKNLATGFATEALQEGAESGGQRMAVNTAMQPYDGRDIMQGVAGEAASGAVLGGLAGGGTGAITGTGAKLLRPRDTEQPASEETPAILPETPPNAAPTFTPPGDAEAPLELNFAKIAKTPVLHAANREALATFFQQGDPTAPVWTKDVKGQRRDFNIVDNDDGSVSAIPREMENIYASRRLNQPESFIDHYINPEGQHVASKPGEITTDRLRTTLSGGTPSGVRSRTPLAEQSGDGTGSAGGADPINDTLRTIARGGRPAAVPAADRTGSSQPAAVTPASEGPVVPQQPNGAANSPGGFAVGTGWKLHLNVSPENAVAISEVLKASGVPHKIGRSGGQDGKEMTVYAGHKDAARTVAQQLHDQFGSVLLPPGKDVLYDDVPFVGNVWGRFSIERSDNPPDTYGEALGIPGSGLFHQYGRDGIPAFEADMGQNLWQKLRLSPEQLTRADAALRQHFGEWYTGTTPDTVPPTGEQSGVVPTIPANLTGAPNGQVKETDANAAGRQRQEALPEVNEPPPVEEAGGVLPEQATPEDKPSAVVRNDDAAFSLIPKANLPKQIRAKEEAKLGGIHHLIAEGANPDSSTTLYAKAMAPYTTASPEFKPGEIVAVSVEGRRKSRQPAVKDGKLVGRYALIETALEAGAIVRTDNRVTNFNEGEGELRSWLTAHQYEEVDRGAYSEWRKPDRPVKTPIKRVSALANLRDRTGNPASPYRPEEDRPTERPLRRDPQGDLREIEQATGTNRITRTYTNEFGDEEGGDYTNVTGAERYTWYNKSGGTMSRRGDEQILPSTKAEAWRLQDGAPEDFAITQLLNWTHYGAPKQKADAVQPIDIAPNKAGIYAINDVQYEIQQRTDDVGKLTWHIARAKNAEGNWERHAPANYFELAQIGKNRVGIRSVTPGTGLDKLGENLTLDTIRSMVFGKEEVADNKKGSATRKLGMLIDSNATTDEAFGKDPTKLHVRLPRTAAEQRETEQLLQQLDEGPSKARSRLEEIRKRSRMAWIDTPSVTRLGYILLQNRGGAKGQQRAVFRDAFLEGWNTLISRFLIEPAVGPQGKYGVSMNFAVYPSEMRDDLVKTYPKGASTGKLIEDGVRTATTRSYPLGPVGTVVTFKNKDGSPVKGYYRVTGVKSNLDLKSEEGRRAWERLEGWSLDKLDRGRLREENGELTFLGKLREQIYSPDAFQTTFERIKYPYDPDSFPNKTVLMVARKGGVPVTWKDASRRLDRGNKFVDAKQTAEAEEAIQEGLDNYAQAISDLDIQANDILKDYLTPAGFSSKTDEEARSYEGAPESETINMSSESENKIARNLTSGDKSTLSNSFAGARSLRRFRQSVTERFGRQETRGRLDRVDAGRRDYDAMREERATLEAQLKTTLKAGDRQPIIQRLGELDRALESQQYLHEQLVDDRAGSPRLGRMADGFIREVLGQRTPITLVDDDSLVSLGDLTPEIRAAANEGRPAWIARLGDKLVVYISSNLNDEEQANELLHELGHYLQHTVLTELIRDVATQVDDQPGRATTEEKEQVLRALFDDSAVDWLKEQGGDWNTATGIEWIRAQERFADQLRAWVSRHEEPRNFVEKFFKGLVDKLRAFWQSLVGPRNLKQEQTFDAFMEALQHTALGKNAPKTELGKQMLRVVREQPRTLRVAPNVSSQVLFSQSKAQELKAKGVQIGTWMSKLVGPMVYSTAKQLRDMGPTGTWIAQQIMPETGNLSNINGGYFFRRQTESAPYLVELGRILGKIPMPTKGSWFHRPNPMNDKRYRLIQEALIKHDTGGINTKKLQSELKKAGKTDAEIAKAVREKQLWAMTRHFERNGVKGMIDKDRSYARHDAEMVYELRDYLDRLHAKITNYGIEMGKIENYFPLVFDHHKWSAERDRVIQILLKEGRRVGWITQDDDAKAETEAAALWSKIASSDGVLFSWSEKMEESPENQRVFGPSFRFKNERVMPPELRNALADYYIGDIGAVLRSYTMAGFKRGIAQAMWGGVNAQGKMDPMYEINRRLLDAQEAGEISPVQLDRVRMKLLPALMGTLGQAEISEQWRATQSWLMTGFNLSALALAPLSSLVELGQIDFRYGKKPFTAAVQGMKLLMDEKGRKELRAFAEHIGSIHIDLTEHMLNDQLNSTYQIPLTHKINEKFFRYTGLKLWTDYTRIIALKMARQSLLEYRELARKGNKEALDYLKEMGLQWYKGDAPEIAAWQEAGMPADVDDHLAVMLALNQWVDSAVLRPNAAMRPVWGNDPRFAIFWHLKDFMWGYHEMIMKRLFARMRDKPHLFKLMPVLMLGAMLLPLGMLGYELRKLLMEDMPAALLGVQPQYREMDGLEYAMEIIRRSGILGGFELAVQSWEAADYGKNFLLAVSGPTVSKFEDFLTHDMDFMYWLTHNVPPFNLSRTLRGQVMGG